MTHSIWISENYNFLNKWSKIWAGQYSNELLSFYTTHLDEKWEKFNAFTQCEREAWSNHFFKMHATQWKSNSKFWKEVAVNNLPDDWEIEDFGEDSLNDIKIDSDDVIWSDWLSDLHRNWGSEEVDKILRTREIYLRLPTHQKVLYDLYITSGLSLRDVAKKLDLPLSAVYKMVLDLKNDIISKWN